MEDNKGYIRLITDVTGYPAGQLLPLNRRDIEAIDKVIFSLDSDCKTAKHYLPEIVIFYYGLGVVSHTLKEIGEMAEVKVSDRRIGELKKAALKLLRQRDRIIIFNRLSRYYLEKENENLRTEIKLLKELLEPKTEPVAEIEPPISAIPPPLAEKTIKELGLSRGLSNCLQHKDVRTIGELQKFGEKKLLLLPNVGPKSLRGIREKLAKLHLALEP